LGRFGGFCFMRRVIALLASLFAVHAATIEAQAVEVYLFKGAGDFSFLSENAHFSRGLNRIAEQLRNDGIYAEVYRYGDTGKVLRAIRRRKPESVAFVGHSMGAFAAMHMARKMQAEGIPVAYVATLDIPGPVGLAGENVQWVENYFSMSPTFALLANTRSHPKARNIYVFSLHAGIDDSMKAHDGILAAIREIQAEEQAIGSVGIAHPGPVAGLGDGRAPGAEIGPGASATPLW
jgi:pimeloyl-ACP methyl ester carboxylesterase